MSITVGLVIFFLFLFISCLAYRYHRGSGGGGYQGRYGGGGDHTIINHIGDHGGGYGGNHAGISHGGGVYQRPAWDSDPSTAVSPPPPAYSPKSNNDDIAQGKVWADINRAHSSYWSNLNTNPV